MLVQIHLTMKLVLTTRTIKKSTRQKTRSSESLISAFLERRHADNFTAKKVNSGRHHVPVKL